MLARVVSCLLLLGAVSAAAAPSGPSLEEKVKMLQESLYRKPVMNLNMERWGEGVDCVKFRNVAEKRITH